MFLFSEGFLGVIIRLIIGLLLVNESFRSSSENLEPEEKEKEKKTIRVFKKKSWFFLGSQSQNLFRIVEFLLRSEVSTYLPN